MSLIVTAALGAAAVFAGSYAVAVGAAIFAGVSSIATAVFALAYVATAFFGIDRQKTRDRQRVIAWIIGIGTLALLVLFAYQFVQALGNAG